MGTTARWLLALAIAALCCSARPARAQMCIGDCDGSGRPTVDELVRGVNILLDRAELTLCPTLDIDSDGRVAVNELVRAVADILYGCGVTPPTPVPTSTPTATATRTSSPAEMSRTPTFTRAATPTRTLGVPNVAGEWREDQFALASSTCIEGINVLVEELIAGLDPCVYTLTQSGLSVMITDCSDATATGLLDEDGVIHFELPGGSVTTQDGCILTFAPAFSGDLKMNPGTVEQTLGISFAGTCDLEPCALVVTSRWTRL